MHRPLDILLVVDVEVTVNADENVSRPILKKPIPGELIQQEDEIREYHQCRLVSLSKSKHERVWQSIEPAEDAW